MVKAFSKNKRLLTNGPAFLGRLSVLLKEGYTFNDALYLLLPHHIKEYEEVLVEINHNFREGHGVTYILHYLGFTSDILLPVAIAEIDGRLSNVLNEMALRLKKTDEARRKAKRLLAYPSMLFVLITLLLLAFRKFFLPNMEALAVSRSNHEKGIVSSLPMIVSKIPDLIFGIGVFTGIIFFGCYLIYKNLTPDKKIQAMIKIPLIGGVFSMWKTRVFTSEMGSLLQSGLSMQEALDVLIGQKLDSILSEIARNIKELVIYGESFHGAVGMTNGLTKQLSSFAKHGADSGHLPKELMIYSEHLDEILDRRLESGLAVLQPALFSLIAICILAAYLALLLPVYGMIDKF